MRVAATLVVLVLLSGVAQAASLDETVRRAVATYPSVPEAGAQRRATEAELDGARAAWGPRAEMDAYIGPHAVDRPASLSKDINREWRAARQAGVSVRQVLFDGWARENEIYKQGMRTNSAAFRVLDRAGLVAMDAIESHIDVVRYSRVMQLAEENIREHQRILADIQTRFSGGGSSAGETEQANERLAAAQAIRSDILRSIGSADARYRKLTGLPAKQLAGARAPKMMPKSKQAALVVAHAHHPMLIAAGFDIRSAEADVEQAKARVLPTIGLEGRASVGQDLGGVSNWNNEAQGKLTMSWTLYDGGVNAAQRRQSVERRTEQELRRDRMFREIDETVAVAWSDLNATSQRLEALRRQSVASDRVVTIYKDEFKAGRRTLIEVLDAQNSRFNTRVATVGAEAISSFTRFKIVATTGRILDEFGVTPPKDAMPLPTGAFGDLKTIGIQLEPIRRP